LRGKKFASNGQLANGQRNQGRRGISRRAWLGRRRKISSHGGKKAVRVAGTDPGQATIYSRRCIYQGGGGSIHRPRNWGMMEQKKVPITFDSRITGKQSRDKVVLESRTLKGRAISAVRKSSIVASVGPHREKTL